MTKRTAVFFFLSLLIFIVASASFGQAAGNANRPGAKGQLKANHAEPSETVEEVFKRTFPQVQADSIRPTGMKGLYEVVIGGRIGYFAPDPGYLLLGDLIDKNGANLTAGRRDELAKKKNELLAEKARHLPLEKALKIGSGKNMVIEITDPDCPYCRNAFKFLSQKADTTEYIFFLPLAMHPDAENKVRYILCSDDKTAAYKEAMEGALDGKKYEVCKKPEMEEVLKAHKEVAAQLGITGTPFFVINGKPITGANFAQMEEAFKQK
jgi:thiol:disulfide interchange protein DsbC